MRTLDWMENWLISAATYPSPLRVRVTVSEAPAFDADVTLQVTKTLRKAASTRLQTGRLGTLYDNTEGYSW